MNTADLSDLPDATVQVNSVNDSSKPLRGAVICCTSVAEEKRTELTALCEQMGATYRADLTLEVTHLIVGDYKTPKYKYVAKERGDVRPMTIQWIEAIRELWIHDKDIDMELLKREYALPTLNSLRISMTGCDDPQERQTIADQVTSNGARYEGDLTKQITHLISFRTEGAKYKAAKSWGIRIVSPEWLRDSLERGMILDEGLYDPVLPLEERGKGAWDRSKKIRRSLSGKRAREDSITRDEGKRKLRRTASTRLNSQSQKMWGDIVGAGPVSQVPKAGQWEATEVDAEQRKNTNMQKESEAADTSRTLGAFSVPEPSDHGIFSGCRFYLHGFDSRKLQVLADHLIAHDASITASPDGLTSPADNRRIMIAPHDLPLSEHPSLPRTHLRIETVNEWWVERCLHQKRFSSPTDHVVGQPFPKFPIEQFQEMKISSAAFSGIDLLHVVKITKILGATYSEDLTPQSTVLVTKSAVGLRKDKLQHAQDWNIPIVHADWLWNSVEAGTRLPFESYKLRGPKRAISAPTSKEPAQNPAPQHGRSRSVSGRPVSRLGDLPENQTEVPPPAAGPDNAFAPDGLNIKEEPAPEDDTTAIPELTNTSSKSGPLSEINPNSPSKSKPTSTSTPAPSDQKHPTRQEDIDNVLSTLIAKNKPRSGSHSHPGENSDGGAAAPPRRRETRLRGRVPSNLSAESRSRSRATSVDSTATHGHPVEYPRSNSANAKPTPGSLPSGSALEDFMAEGSRGKIVNGGFTNVGEDNQPPLTQVTYKDPESEEQQERIMAKMRGEKIERGRGKGKEAERSLTIGGVVGGIEMAEKRQARPRGRPKMAGLR